ncbi:MULTISPECIES: hypothetical protein [Enterobacteriaceae]|jgi:hypothetical protein|uniref:Uncharacterized protein n=3 Tax=Leclercia adecarboxylata TaxID=83655 RepID=A0A6H0A3U1_9ENTR|nr:MULTISPECIES: hypothetical protein [Enterobacteriaceae]MCW4706089.1 hypothetical protein [Enterobacter kobei]MDV5280008.1 hypothetical protein [Leclercia adecarboxylata]MDV5463941.1 hypothetical protein [Leclercia adecarboxylata]MDV5505822.1 hypothetical protein [Leclercia adecarboxylata]MDV5624109.1 hypothetical protein [Leclercia adecarboxylata]
MMSKLLERPKLEKPERASKDTSSRLTNISTKKKNTTGETPKTVRMTPAEKLLALELVDQIQALTHKNITVSTLLRASLYLAQAAGPEKVLKAIKENI